MIFLLILIALFIEVRHRGKRIKGMDKENALLKDKLEDAREVIRTIFDAGYPSSHNTALQLQRQCDELVGEAEKYLKKIGEVK